MSSIINNNIYKGEYIKQNMSKTKYFVIPFLVMLTIVTMSMMVSAAVTLRSPVTATAYSTNMLLNCTLTTADVTNATNVTFYYSETGVEAQTVLTTVQNTSLEQLEFTKTQSITALTDATTYNFTCMATNNSVVSVNSTGVLSVTIDNTVPTCTVTKTKYLIEVFTDPNTLTCSCTDVIDTTPTNTRTLTKPSGATVDITTDSYVTLVGNTDQVGKYTYACYATDDATNVATTASTTFIADTSEEVDSSTGKAKAFVQTNMMIILLAIAAVVVIIIILFAVLM